jgi:hypothetical protein
MCSEMQSRLRLPLWATETKSIDRPIQKPKTCNFVFTLSTSRRHLCYVLRMGSPGRSECTYASTSNINSLVMKWFSKQNPCLITSKPPTLRVKKVQHLFQTFQLQQIFWELRLRRAPTPIYVFRYSDLVRCGVSWPSTEFFPNKTNSISL